MASLRWTSASTVLALLLVPACYEGPEDIDGEAWIGESGENSEDGSEDDDGAQDGSGNASGGNDSGGSGNDPGDPGSDSDSGPADPNDDPGDPGDDSGDPGDDSGNPGDDSGDPGDDSGDPPPPSDEVPDNAYCSGVADWNAAHTQLENEILEIVNQRRAEGANCGSAGSFGPAAPLSMDPALRCAARVHSKDMVDRNFFDHTNPSGESPFQRMAEAGYSYSTAGENIAAGNSTAAATMQQWMDSDGHCGNIMNPDFTELGVGYYPGGQYGHVWTQNFGAP
ncbi:MAG: CAP domain-containing protein [Nannocystaceae bacterium]|nr:CAP domain-containing protein [bacterium]